ncbi:glutathione s-transferase [Colletotrichum chrysophilum]|uniref:Glutathione s-transferase n=1 Tax=Colletotrichum chrysophilum TaxID=1836956 RepID=A0AAD9A3Q5_9PEZI|nr:glutathione s-transferase [Colletotrichum chrysophilum]
MSVTKPIVLYGHSKPPQDLPSHSNTMWLTRPAYYAPNPAKVVMILRELEIPYEMVSRHLLAHQREENHLTTWADQGGIHGRQKGTLHDSQPQRPPPRHHRSEHGHHPLGVGRHHRVPRRDVRHREQAVLHFVPRKVSSEAVPGVPNVRTGPLLWPARVVQDVPPRRRPERQGEIRGADCARAVRPRPRAQGERVPRRRQGVCFAVLLPSGS